MKGRPSQLFVVIVGVAAVLIASIAMAADPKKTPAVDLVAEGAVQPGIYDTISIGGTTLEPANEHVGLPAGVRPGDRVRVRYYTQNGTNYFMEIVREGQAFSTETEAAAGADDQV